jgi:hypothetical protein
MISRRGSTRPLCKDQPTIDALETHLDSGFACDRFSEPRQLFFCYAFLLDPQAVGQRVQKIEAGALGDCDFTRKMAWARSNRWRVAYGESMTSKNLRTDEWMYYMAASEKWKNKMAFSPKICLRPINRAD